jgi:hypothetical protein
MIGARSSTRTQNFGGETVIEDTTFKRWHRYYEEIMVLKGIGSEDVS